MSIKNEAKNKKSFDRCGSRAVGTTRAVDVFAVWRGKEKGLSPEEYAPATIARGDDVCRFRFV